jgi:hypothetical protein
MKNLSERGADVGCHAHGFAWAWDSVSPMPTQSRGHGTRAGVHHGHDYRWETTFGT